MRPNMWICSCFTPKIFPVVWKQQTWWRWLVHVATSTTVVVSCVAFTLCWCFSDTQIPCALCYLCVCFRIVGVPYLVYILCLCRSGRKESCCSQTCLQAPWSSCLFVCLLRCGCHVRARRRDLEGGCWQGGLAGSGQLIVVVLCRGVSH